MGNESERDGSDSFPKTGLVIANNSHEPIRPLKKILVEILEVYNSSKTAVRGSRGCTGHVGNC